MNKKFKRLISSFRCLKDWEINISKSKTLSGMCGFGKNNNVTIYDWTEQNRPSDFELHEVLHIAIRDIVRTDKRKTKLIRDKEEVLVQDICKLFKEAP